MDVVPATLRTISNAAIRQGLFALLLKGGVPEFVRN